MSVTTYEIGCNYLHQKLKNKVYFISNNNADVSIDNGAASVSITGGITPNVLEGFGIKFTETESLDERYKFTKQLNRSINGHLTDTTWLLENDFYIMIETIEDTFYLINVDFPSKMSFTYNLSNSQDQTDFVFTSNSNFPALKVNSVSWESFNTCKTYHVPGVDYLKLLEKDYATIDKENGVVNLFDSHVFKNIDYLKNTISLSESYDGDVATTTISFEIPFDDYKTSWQYNLLEFKQNLYVAEVGNVNGNAIFAGFEHGLEPQYEINGSTSESESTSIKITLTEASNWGIFEYDSWSYYNVPEKKWVGVDSEVKCIGLGYGINTLMMEVDENGTPTGRYKCLEGYESEYTDYNIITSYTESDVESFSTSVCTRFRAREAGGTGIYTCINGDKYEFIGDGVSYDGGKTWDYSNIELGPMVESASSWCELPVQYKWEITDDSTCLIEIERWTPSGYTCVGYDKYQNNVKEISHDGGTTWENTGIESASTLIETQSSDCGCEPLDAKYRMTFNDGTVMSAECDSTSAITNHFFYNYRDKLIFAEIGDCVTSIAGSAFTYCSKIEQIVIGSGVTEMGGDVFKGCSELNSVVIKATTPPTANGNVLRNSTCIVYVPSESLNAYKAAPAWVNYKTRIQAIP